ncbi:hypothetical protein [Amycolatopsis sp. WGS_07]|uniref:hypothetical protein n=1 Tax=Amycolatopsis sp. WGS_07 TaxID=3076764 RepID=UPI0038732C31
MPQPENGAATTRNVIGVDNNLGLASRPTPSESAAKTGESMNENSMPESSPEPTTPRADAARSERRDANRSVPVRWNIRPRDGDEGEFHPSNETLREQLEMLLRARGKTIEWCLWCKELMFATPDERDAFWSDHSGCVPF